MNRREFLKAGAAVAAASVIPPIAIAGGADFNPQPSAWRSFEVTTKVNPQATKQIVRAWLPLVQFRADDWNRPEGNRWTTNAAVARIERDLASGADMLFVEWKAGEMQPVVEIVSRIATRDRATDLARAGTAVPLTATERIRYLSGTRLAPVDGIVAETASRIVGNATSDVEKARLLYDWMVENTYRRASTRGCGDGDIVAMLKSGDLGGKCADLNPLYVALARATGIPARDLYGIRVAPSKFGYKALGANSTTITRSQHCRAEIHLDGFGWVAVDPADVRKVMLEEQEGGLDASDSRVIAARKALFGSWEGNWIAFNDANDLVLPGSDGGAASFLMYPQAEVGQVRLDCLEPDLFQYSISTREISI
ncbi:MAG: transglutaminase-like domain-containing protein [Phyllobacterium sp.]